MRFRSFVVAALAAACAPLAHAANWSPVGPTDGIDALVATHPLVPGKAVIQGGNIFTGFGLYSAPATTYVTNDGGASWASNARPPVGGRPSLAGSSVVYLDGNGSVQRSNDDGRSFFPVTLPPPPFGGFTAFASANPANPDELVAWAGAVVHRSLDGGVTWTADPPAPGGIGALIVDWSARRLYASFGLQPIGHRALDGGAWGLGGPGNVRTFHAANGIAILQVEIDRSLHRSIDGGATYVPAVAPPDNGPICAYASGSAASQRIYALECQAFPIGARILRSNDAGATWAYAGGVVSTDLEAQPSIAVDAGNASLVYVATRKGVLVSTDAGATLAPLPRATNAPGSERRMILDGIDSARQWVADDNSGFFRSTDGGATWTFVVSEWHPIASSRSRTATLFALTLTSTSFAQSFGVSTDGGTSFVTKIQGAAKSAGLGPLGYGIAPGELFVYGSSGGGRQFHYSNDDGETFMQRFAPPVAAKVIVAAAGSPNAVYVGGSPLNAGDPQLYRSLDNAITWQPVATFPAPLSDFGGTTGNTMTAFAVDPATPTRLYAGFRFPDYLMRSDDSGATWTRITSGLGAGPIMSIAFDPSNASTLYVAQFSGGVFRSADRGATWTALDAGLGDEMVLKLEHDPFTPDRLYASTGSGVYRTQVSTGLPAGDRRAIEYYHAPFNHYFVSADLDEIAGLDAGVFAGWGRTGEAFRVAEGNDPGNLPVCRFFGVGFAPLSSHFYTPYPQECEIVKADPKWFYEKIAFGLALPDPATHGCPPASRALYRLWNRNQGGAPNHRYTTSQFTLGAMIGLGWIFEGEAQTRVFACVPY
jgi:photosystem II stability/assembly factor-like uncharacterized protein